MFAKNHKVLGNSPITHVFSSLLLMGALTACPSVGPDDDGVVEVDTTPPAAPSLIEATQLDRVTSSLSWVAPADDDGLAVVSYELRYARDPLPAGGFDAWGEVIATPLPSDPGATDSALHNDLPGYGFYVGIVAFDDAGNRSEPATAGPFFLDVISDAARTPPAPEDNDNGLGYQIEAGDFNGDQYLDLAVSAPFKQVVDAQGAGAVYVYFGSPTGISDAPDLELAGTEASGQFGNSMASLDWDDDNIDDIAIGAPFGAGYSGQVYIFLGATIGAGNSLRDTDADVIISVDPNSSWFAGSILGWTLAGGRFDGDGRDDLAAASVFADGGVGGVVTLYGGTAAAGDITLSEVDPALMNGAVASVVFAPGEVPGDSALFGSAMANLGRNGPGNPDQLGVAFFQGADSFILRGREDRPADPGVHVQTFDPAIDLRATVEQLDEETFFAFSQSAIMDIDGDGIREVAIGSYREGEDAGRVTIINGASVGEEPLGNITVSEINGVDGQRFGSAIAGHGRGYGTPDFDNDGNIDLVIAGGAGPDSTGMSLFVWYNDGFHDFSENLTPDTADLVFAGPEPEFTGNPPTNGGTPITARSIGDINSDGFADMVWSDWEGNDRDGSFVVIH